MTVPGKGGRPAKPTALHLLHGESRPSVINVNEPLPTEGEIVPPEGMSDEALEVWHELSADLIRTGVLQFWDVNNYREYCEAVVTSREAQAALDEEGEVIDSPIIDRQGKVTGHRTAVNPWWKVKREAVTAMLAQSARFGLTPADRTRIQVDNGGRKPKEQDNSDLMSG